MQPTRRDKLRAHAEQILDAFLGLRSTFAMLEPALFDRTVIDRWEAGYRARGLHLITSALLQWCVLEITKIALDKDKRTPSVSKLVDALEGPIVAELREKFAVWFIAPHTDEKPEVIALLQKMERQEEYDRRQRFDCHIDELRSGWINLRDSPQLTSIGTMRDKLIAHRELWHDGEKYQPLDTSSLGLKFSDLRTVIDQLGLLVELINLVYRNASFDFDDLDRQLASTAGAFWSPS